MRKAFEFDLQLFSSPDAGGGSGGDGTGGDGATGGDAGDGKVNFTVEQQAALEKILGERVSRAERTAEARAKEQAAKDAGFATVEEYEAAVKEWSEHREAQKTELEREKEARAKAEEQAKQAAEQVKKATLHSAFALEAAGKVVSVPDAFTLAEAELMKLEVGDGLKDSMKQIVEGLVKERPWLAPSRQGSGSAGGGNPPRGDGSKDEGADRAREMARKRMGITSGGSSGDSISALADKIADALANRSKS